MERLGRANLVLLVEEPSDNPWIFDGVHQRLSGALGLLFYMLHLRVGIEDDGADLLVGSSVNAVPEIRRVSQMPTFYRSQGRASAPITPDWLEESRVLRDAVAPIKDDKIQFRRVIRGLNTLFKGLKKKQDRIVFTSLSGRWRLSSFRKSARPKTSSCTAAKPLRARATTRAPCCWKPSRCGATQNT